MNWKTKITELLGCKYPILQGATERIGTWQFAASIATAGAHGTITGSVSKTPEKLQDDIRKCRKATAGSFGVNLSIGLCPRIDEMLDVCIEEKVPVETSAYKPDSLAPRLKKARLTWLHKAARIKDAVHAQELGADAIILVGMEGAGIKNPEQLPTMTTILWGTRKLSVPIIAAGGIGNARGLLGALALGAEGVMMGSAFMTTKECPISNESKEKMIRLNPDDQEFRRRVLMPVPVNRSGTPVSDPAEIDWSRAVSFSVVGIDHILSAQELIQGIISDAENIANNRQ
jgi:NADH:quinone reductase (non-electrogenic)